MSLGRIHVNAPVPKMTIVRHPDAHRQQQQRQPSPVKRAAAPGPSVAARLEELQERIYQEQNIIMQTSNALNQCCGSNSSFAGSQEAVECHKLLLISSEYRSPARCQPPQPTTPAAYLIIYYNYACIDILVHVSI